MTQKCQVNVQLDNTQQLVLYCEMDIIRRRSYGFHRGRHEAKDVVEHPKHSSTPSSWPERVVLSCKRSSLNGMCCNMIEVSHEGHHMVFMVPGMNIDMHSLVDMVFSYIRDERVSLVGMLVSKNQGDP